MFDGASEITPRQAGRQAGWQGSKLWHYLEICTWSVARINSSLRPSDVFCIIIRCDNVNKHNIIIVKIEIGYMDMDNIL